MKVFLPAMAIATCLGIGKARNADTLFAGVTSCLRPDEKHQVYIGAIDQPLPGIPEAFRAEHQSRNNQILFALLQELSESVTAAVARYGRHRVAVLLGTSTSGIAEGAAALAEYQASGAWPQGFRYSQQETGAPARFVADVLGITGPAYVVATACSSSAKVFGAGRRLIRQGLADAVIVGGADSLCDLTLAGFSSLGAVSDAPCQPFQQERKGINIGEGGALFLMTTEPADVALIGIGETSDAYHISAPDPAGLGAMATMQAALDDAGLPPEAVGYVNLHGTATHLNDAMESVAVHAVFGVGVPCSSTKALTGHTLGAAGAIEAAFLWLTVSRAWNPGGVLPPQMGRGTRDPEGADIHLVTPADRWAKDMPRVALSSSFAFGGSNCALILEQTS